METVLDSIKSLPGVSCAFYYDPQIGIVSRKSEPTFTEENLAKVGQIVEKFFSWGMELFADLKQIRLNYDDSSVQVLKPSGSPYLVFIHETGLDTNLLELTLAQALENPGMNASAPTASSGAAAPAGSTPVSGNDANSKKLETLLNSGPIAQILSALESSLNKVMGPMASFVFSDTRQTWIGSVDHLSKGSIEKLVQMLCNEIGDQEKANTFRELITPHIESL